MSPRRGDSNQFDLFLARDSPVAHRSDRGGSGEVRVAPVHDAVNGIAAGLPREVRLGTSSWSFPGWAGIVYGESTSKQRLARHGLAAYARHPLLRAVGIDRTYYGPVPAAELAAYAAVVPDDFRFLMKAHEACTVGRFPNHPRYGDAAGCVNELFLDAAYARDQVVAPCVEGLGDKGGPLLFQFSPQDLAAVGGPDGFVDRLGRFLDALPRGPLYAVELRDARLLTSAYRDVLAATGVCHCFNVHPTMPDIEMQVRRLGTDFPATVVRWMLGRGMEYEQARDRYDPFDRIVDADPGSRGQIAAHCAAAVRAKRPTYVIINNKAEGSAPLSAFTLAAALAALANR
jgi:uncharacterized protein YecE (DUF72 family)